MHNAPALLLWGPDLEADSYHTPTIRYARKGV